MASTVGAACRDTSCYQEEFDPTAAPRVAPLERDCEKPFKCYRYFPARNPGDCTLDEVRRMALREPSGK